MDAPTQAAVGAGDDVFSADDSANAMRRSAQFRWFDEVGGVADDSHNQDSFVLD